MAGDPSDLVTCSNPAIEAWLQTLAGRGANFSALLAARDSGGFGHTLREICQQPATWTETARRLLPFREAMAACLASCRRIVLTGSGSSQYAGECVAPVLQRCLRRAKIEPCHRANPTFPGRSLWTRQTRGRAALRPVLGPGLGRNDHSASHNHGPRTARDFSNSL